MTNSSRRDEATAIAAAVPVVTGTAPTHDAEIKRLYERWKELGEQAERKMDAAKRDTTLAEGQSIENEIAVLDDERQEIEQALVAIPAVGIAGVMIKLSVAKYWIGLDAGADIEDQMVLSAYGDLERSLIEAAG